MKIIRPVSRKEMKRAFVVANIISKQGGRGRHINHLPEKTFRKMLANIKSRVLKMKESQLDKIIADTWKKRLRAYNMSDWHLATATTAEVGVWSHAGDLPLSWTNGSLAETAKKVKSAIESNPKSLKNRSRRSIPNILKTNVRLLQKEKYLLPIVFKHHTGTGGRNRLKMRLAGDIDDGCMRSIALAVAGSKTLKVYFGVPIKE